MRACRIVITALMLVLSARAENAAHGTAPGDHPRVAGDAASAKNATSQRFLDGFWARIPAEEPVPERAPVAEPATPGLTATPMPPTMPALQLHAMPVWRRWLLPRWSYCVTAIILTSALGVALAGALRGTLLELRLPRRLRQLAAVKALYAWGKTPAPSFTDLLQTFREFYQLPAGCDADAVAAVVGKTDAELAQLILTMDRQRFAPAANSPTEESAAGGPDVTNAACSSAGEAATSVSTAMSAGSTEVAVVSPVSSVPHARALLARWLRRRPRSVPGRASAAVAVLLGAAAILALAAVIAAAGDLTRRDDVAPAWNRALQHATEHNYAHSFDVFLAIERISPSSPELSHNLAVLAVAIGRVEDARAWRRHAQIQGQLREQIHLADRDWRWPLAVPALLLLTVFVGFWVAAMGWPSPGRRTLARHAWMLLPLLLCSCCVLLLIGHWRQCRRLQELAVVLTAQPLRVTPGETTFEQAPVVTTDPTQAQGVATDSSAPLAQLSAGDCVLLRQQRNEWCFVSVNGNVGWLPRSAMLPFRL